LVTGAAFSLVIAVVEVGTWINHWYIAEQFLAPLTGGTSDTPALRDIALLLRTGNQKLLAGICWLGGALLLVVVAGLVRRRRASAQG
jgi:hypothetical protein